MADRKKGDGQEVIAPSRLTEGVLVLALLAAIVWCLVSVVPLVPAVLMASDIDNYRPARFVVDELVYRTARGNDRYYAKGRIDGQPEELELHDLAPIFESREALEKHFGQQPVSFAVMYNPNRMRAKRNDGSTRVLPAQEGFAVKHRNDAWRAAFSTLGSFVLTLLALTALVSVHKWRTKS